MREAVEEGKPILWLVVVLVVLGCTTLRLEVLVVVVVRNRVLPLGLVQEASTVGRRRGELERTVPVFVLPVAPMLLMLLPPMLLYSGGGEGSRGG